MYKEVPVRHFVIDTDTASDDAVALVMALKYPDVRVEAITVVAGNVPLEIGVQNALYTVERCGARVPVYAGIAGPMLRPLQTAQFCHGQDGFGPLAQKLHENERLVYLAIPPSAIPDRINGLKDADKVRRFVAHARFAGQAPPGTALT